MKVLLSLASQDNTPLGELLEIVREWVYKGDPKKYDVLGAKIEHLVKLMKFPASATRPRGNTLYRGLGLPTAEVKAAVKSGRIKLKPRLYSSWTDDPVTTSRYLQDFDYGVVVSCLMPVSSVILNFHWLASEISNNPGARAQLSSKQNEFFQQFRNEIASEREYVVKNCPTEFKVAGVIGGEDFINRLEEHDEGLLDDGYDESGGAYISLQDLPDVSFIK